MKRLLLVLMLLFCVAGFGQVHTFPALDTSNTWTGPNDFSGAPFIKVPIGPNLQPSISGQIAYDSFNNKYGGGFNGTYVKFASVSGSLTPGNCLKSDANGNIVDVGAACGSGSGGGGGYVLTFGSVSVPLSSPAFPPVYAINAASGDTDLYTVPVNRLAMVIDVSFTNPTGSGNTMTGLAEVKISGVYHTFDFFALGAAAGTYGGTASLAPFLLHAGETFSVNLNHAGFSVWPFIVEFDSGANINDSRLFSLAAGNNTVFTVPVGKSVSFIGLPSAFNLPDPGHVWYWNNSPTRTVQINAVPSAGTPSTGNAIFNASVANQQMAQPVLYGGLNPGDFINVTTDSSAATQVAWVIFTTNVSGSGGGGGGGGGPTTFQVNGSNTTAQSPINLQNGPNITITNPSAGNVQVSMNTTFVTSVAETFTGGLISVAGSPVTTSGTLALTVAGTSGGIPYFNSVSTWQSSAALTANGVVLGGGPGASPVVTAADSTTTHALFATAGAPAFRALVIGDLPSISWAFPTTGTATSTATFPGGDLFGGGLNAQSGTSYTVAASDENKLVTLSNAAAVAVTLPQATTGGFTSGAMFHLKNLGVGTVTVTPTTSQIDGGSTLTLLTSQGADIYSDGTNYWSQGGKGAGAVTSVFGRTGAVVATSGDYSFSQISGSIAIGQTPLTTVGDILSVNASVALARVAQGITGSYLQSVNANLPTFNVPGIPGSPDVNAASYTVRCDSATATLDRGQTVRFVTTAPTVTFPDPSASGCGNNFATVLIASGVTVTVNRTTTATFNIYNGSTTSAGQTTFALTSGQYATISSPDNSVYIVRVGAGGGSGTVTTSGGPTSPTHSCFSAAAIITNCAIAFTTLTDGATITWAIASNDYASAQVTLAGSRTLNITSPVNGGQYLLKIIQDGSGSHGLTLGTGCTWKVINGGGGAITPSTAPNAVDVLTFTYDGANCYANLGKNYS